MAVLRAKQRLSYLEIPIGILLVLAVLYIAKVVVVPLVVAILLTFILTPIVIALQRFGIKRAYGVVLTVLLALTLAGLAAYIVGSQIHSLAKELPKHRQVIEAKIATLREGGGAFSNLLQMFREIGESKSVTGERPLPGRDVIITRPEEPSSAEQIFQTVIPFIEPLAHTGFVIVLVLFMLFHREDLRNRFLGLLGDGRLTGTTRVIVDSAQRISRYLLTQSLINLAFGACFTLGLYVIGVEYAILWGFVTALMRFVPYIGTWTSLLLPLVLSFATAPTWTQPVALIGYFSVLELIVANLIEPLLLGHHTGVSPIALLVAAAFWTWLWGPMGLVLSTPLTVCLVVIGQHVPQFRFFALLLGDQPPLAPPIRYYQRLLARDQEEAEAVAAEFATAEGPERVYDKVLLPALAIARQDRKEAGLGAEDEEFILNATGTIMTNLEAISEKSKAETAPATTELDKAAAETAAPAEPLLRPLILGCPAHQQTEELTLRMLANLVKKDGCDVEVISTRALPTEIETRIEQQTPAVIFIAVLPPGGLVQARYLCRRLSRRFGGVPIVVGYWGEVNDFDKLLRQVRSAGGDYVATSLLQARSQIASLIHPATLTAPPAKGTTLQAV